MKMKLLFLGMITIMVLSGCGTQYVCDDGTTVSDPSMCKVKESVVEEKQVVAEEKQEIIIEEDTKEVILVEEPVEKIAPIVKDIDGSVQKLFDKAQGKKDNFKYTFVAPKNEYIKDIFVSGDYVREVFHSGMYDGDKRHPQETKYDSLFFNTADETAFRMCVDPESCDDITKVTKVDFAKFYEGTVIDIINSIVVAKDTGSSEMVDGRRGQVISYKLENSEEGRMWIDSFYGTPIKKEFTGKDGEKVFASFREFEPGFVSDEEVQMP